MLFKKVGSIILIYDTEHFLINTYICMEKILYKFYEIRFAKDFLCSQIGHRDVFNFFTKFIDVTTNYCKKGLKNY